jgi:hypothetical protein
MIFAFMNLLKYQNNPKNNIKAIGKETSKIPKLSKSKLNITPHISKNTSANDVYLYRGKILVVS